MNEQRVSEQKPAEQKPAEQQIAEQKGSLESKAELLKRLEGNFSQKELMNKTHTNIYITDVKTDEIVFMSRQMQKEFGIQDPEGKICWQVLQKGQEGRCECCKISALLSGGDRDAVCVWDQKSTLNGKIYKNTDTLLYLDDGSVLHMQYSLDVTEYRELYHSARIDELTGMLNRAAGKEYLFYKMKKAKEIGEPFMVALYDVNDLKKVNDIYGHREGDHMLKFISDTVRENLSLRDVVFRLGGDEFVIVFADGDEALAQEKIQRALVKMEEEREEQEIFYSLSFSYGMVKVRPEENQDVNDILMQVDQRMYVQKRGFHIQKSQKNLHRSSSIYQGRVMQICQYEYDHLFHLLELSTDKYMFIGYLKNGTFQYSKNIVDDFQLSGKMVPNALAVWGELVHPDDRREYLERHQEIMDGRMNGLEMEYRAINRKGEWVWLQTRGNMLTDENGEPELFAGMITNLGHKGMTDIVTGLYSKYELEGRLKEWSIRKKNRNTFTLMLLGIDRFKYINERYDRTFGDDVLRNLARKIDYILPDYTYMYRMDGDVFALLIEDDKEDAAQQLYLWIQHMFKDRQELNGKRYDVSFSAGYVIYPEDGENSKELMKNVHYALEYSKRMGRGRITRYFEDMCKNRETEINLMELLQDSVSRGFKGFSLVYQPLIRTDGKEMYGAEALLRWRSEEGVEVSPTEIIPLLEQTGLIAKVGKWLVQEAVRQCSQWSMGGITFHMSVNISQYQLDERSLQRILNRCLSEYCVLPEQFYLELKDTSMILQTPEFLDCLRDIHNMGVRIILDNFGTGDSSFENLRELPVDVVKIDRAFAPGVAKEGFDRETVRSIAQFCHQVGKDVILDGVETAEVFDAAMSLGLDYLQGFYTGIPMDGEEYQRTILGIL